MPSSRRRWASSMIRFDEVTLTELSRIRVLVCRSLDLRASIRARLILPDRIRGSPKLVLRLLTVYLCYRQPGSRN